MAEQKDKDSPATTSCAYDAMAPRWDVIDTLLGGTEAMRAKATTYAPQHKAETEDDYVARLAATVLRNFVEDTLDTLASKPFGEETKLNDDIPETILPLLDDVDLQGNKLDVFARKWFRTGVAKAFCHVLVDTPKPAGKTNPNGSPRKRTLDDDRKEGNRPYWVLLAPEAVIFARASIVDGKEVLQHIRIIETYTEQVGFAEVEQQQIRILEPGSVQIWRPHPTQKKNNKPVWFRFDAWETGLDVIPLVTFYARRESLMYAKPPLLDLAWLNIAHWQSTSDQRHVLTVARYPMLACSGDKDESDPVVVGPNKILYNPDPQGKFYYVEHTGAAIEAGRNDLQDLEAACSSYGAQFMEEKPGDQTATAKAIDSADSTSDLASITGVFEDAVAQALGLTALWLGDKKREGGTVELVKNYNQAQEDEAALTTLTSARGTRDISRKTYLEQLVLRGVLPSDFDVELEMEQLLEEQDTMLERAGFNLDPLGQPTKPADPNAPEGGGPPAPTPAPAGRKPAKKAPKKAAKKVK